MQRHFNPPYNELPLSTIQRQQLRHYRMRTIIDAGDYAIETNRPELIPFLHEFLDIDEKAYKDEAETSTTKEQEQC